MASHYDHSLRPRKKKQTNTKTSLSIALIHSSASPLYRHIQRDMPIMAYFSNSKVALNKIPQHNSLLLLRRMTGSCVCGRLPRPPPLMTTVLRLFVKVTHCGDIATRSQARPEESSTARLLISVHVLRHTQIFIIRQQTNIQAWCSVPF